MTTDDYRDVMKGWAQDIEADRRASISLRDAAAECPWQLVPIGRGQNLWRCRACGYSGAITTTGRCRSIT